MSEFSFVMFRGYMAICLLWYVESLETLRMINMILHYKEAKQLIPIKWLCFLLTFLFRKDEKDFDVTTTHKSILIIFIFVNLFFLINVFNIIFVICNAHFSFDNDKSYVFGIILLVIFLNLLIHRVIKVTYTIKVHENYKKIRKNDKGHN